MKKSTYRRYLRLTCTFLALTLLVLFLFSCSGKNVEVEYDSNTGNYTGGGVGDRPLLTIESLSEYKKFIKEATLPEDFVYYEDVKSLGVFKDFTCLSESRSNDYSQYVYSLYDDGIGELNLYIERDPPIETEVTKTIITDVNSKDIRYLDSNIHGAYREDGLTYVFLRGELFSIKWKSGEWYYTISSINDLNADTSKSEISKLFNLNTSFDFISTIAKPEVIE